MEKLNYRDLEGIDQHREYAIPPDAVGVNFTVEHDHEYVGLVIDGHTFSLTKQGARDLALALRQAANEIERDARWRR